MNNELLYNIVLQLQGQNQVIAGINRVQNTTTNMVSQIQRQLNQIKLQSIISNVNSLADGLNSLTGPGNAFNASMKDLEAMTGLAGDKLKEIEGYARNSAKIFGGSAADSVESYKLILGQLSPEIAKVPAALDSMGKTVMTTSKLMGGDAIAATEVLTTAMNQYGISLDDPIKASQIMAAMMNVMSAASKEGSAELPALKAALEQSGMAAKSAGVAFEETNAAIEVLDAAGKKGSEGGVALRNVLSSLGQGRFLPKRVQEEFQKLGINVNALNDPTKTLADRLDILKPLLNDSALMSAMFGKENSNAAMALISQTEEIRRMTEAVKGTNSANEQAAIIMESQAEKNARLKAQVDDFKISLFNATNGWLGYASVIGDASRDIANIAPLFTAAGSALSFLTSKQKLAATWTSILQVKQWALNAAMYANPVGIIVAAIVALIAIIGVAIYKYDEWGAALLQFMGPIGWVINGFKSMYDHWESIKKAFKTEGIIGGLKRLNQVLMNAILKPLEQILEMLNSIDPTGFVDKALNNVKLTRERLNLITEAERNKTSKNPIEGIAQTIGIPGAGGVGGFGGTGSGDDAAGKEAAKVNEAIATGGTKHNYITINLKDLVGTLHIEGKSFKETTAQMEQAVLDALLRVTASATTAAS